MGAWERPRGIGRRGGSKTGYKNTEPVDLMPALIKDRDLETPEPFTPYRQGLRAGPRSLPLSHPAP